MHQLLDILKDLPGFLDTFIRDYGLWVYALLFAIIFAETGLVILPFLPGDSLLFAVGAVAARGAMDVWTIAIVLIIAGVLGDAVNYHVGKFIGPRIFKTEGGTGLYGRLLNRRHLARAHEFFEKYGGKAVFLARFVPIVRTFIPFVAGAGAMTYSRFVLYNITGAVAWVSLCIGAGYMFGGMEFVKKNFEAVIVGIVVISIIPMVIEYFLARRRARSARSGGQVQSDQRLSPGSTPAQSE
jgi:membrane-associated protein